MDKTTRATCGRLIRHTLIHTHIDTHKTPRFRQNTTVPSREWNMLATRRLAYLCRHIARKSPRTTHQTHLGFFMSLFGEWHSPPKNSSARSRTDWRRHPAAPCYAPQSITLVLCCYTVKRGNDDLMELPDTFPKQ